MNFYLLLLMIVSHTVNCQIDEFDDSINITASASGSRETTLEPTGGGETTPEPAAIITRPCLYGCNGFTCETCRPGYVPPRCCECDEGYYYINNYDYYGNFYGFYDYYGRCEPYCYDGCDGPTCETCRPGYVTPGCCLCDEGYHRTPNGTCEENFCIERCESLNDNNMSCMSCIAGYQPPNCCECEEGYLYLSVLNVWPYNRPRDRVCCQNSMIDIEGTYNNYFFPYNESNGDERLLPHAIDLSYGPRKLEVPVNVFNTLEYDLYISTNGLISFRNPYSSHWSRSFSKYFSSFRGPIIAPFWTDLVSEDSVSSIYYRTTNDSAILDRIGNITTGFNQNFSDYQPSLAIIVTWEDVLSYSERSLQMSFQVVLSTDGKTSFAIFLYGDVIRNLLACDLHNSLDVFRRLTVGFNAGDRERFLNIPRSDLEEINVFRIDGNCIPADEVQCPLKSVSIQCAPQLVCICDEGIQSPFCIDFFPYGARSGDTIGPHAIDKSVGIMLNISVVFFQRKETNIYMSTNGVISFRSELMDSFNPVPFPSSSVPLIAPFWTDFDFRDVGSIYYRVTQDQKALTKFSKIVSEKNPNISYHPTLCVIMTWSSATLYLNSYRKTLTFQVVLATDGEVSFAAFLYDNPYILGNIASNVNALVGFDAGDQSRSSTIMSNRQRNYIPEFINVFRIDGNCITGISPGTVCGLKSTSLTCHNNLTISSCLCEPGITDIRENNCILTEFFPFGIGNGDTVGPRAVDASSEVIHLDVPIIFYQKAETDLYVSTNGLLSFQQKFDSHIVTQLPRSEFPHPPLIATFWADFSFRESGTIYYRVVNDSVTLSHVAQKVANASVAFRAYMPTSAVIITWFQSKVFRLQSNLINFQAILSTDGNVSFAVMLYGDLMQSVSEEFTWLIGGFDAGDGKRGYASSESLDGLTYNITEDEEDLYIYRIDGNCVVRAGNDMCGFNAVPILCRNFSSLSCLCNTGTKSRENNTCLEYLQFGPRAGDATIEEPIATSQSLTLSTPLVFYGNPLSTINIFECGVISPGSFNCDNLPNSPSNTLPMIVPYLLLRNNFDSTRRYHIFHYRKAVDNTTLDEVTTMITDFNSNLTKYYPTLAVVITLILDDREEQNSVQAILCTDGKISFVIFLYEHPGRVSHNRQLPLGFYAGDMDRKLVISQRNRLQTKNIFRIDGNCITTAYPSDVCRLNSFASRCDSSSATNCSCYSGYENVDEKNCKDKDECVADSPCSINAQCKNTEGSFMCTCHEGFDGDGFNCTDINECVTGSLCDNNALCENTEGSFMCVCKEGFDGDGFNCTDIDECEEGTSNCTQICNNEDGGYFCTCNDGYQSDSDNRTCKDTDECGGDHECTQLCLNTDGGYNCACRDGFYILSDNKTCQDIVSKSNNSAVIGGAIGIISAILVTVIVIVLLIFFVRKRKPKKVIELSAPRGVNIRYLEEMRENHYVRQLRQMSVQHNIPKELIIKSCNLDLGKTVGQGEFGIVYKSRLKTSHHDTISDIVAVKTLKGFVQNDLVRDLLKECVKMHELDHPNVLKLIGVCLDGGPAPYIIMPFMDNGSLLSHLKAERESIVLDPNCSNMEDIKTIMKRLMDMCIQVAKGMEYLASKRIVHRDLAARNCMIDVNFVIKVADFGLAESIDMTKDYFRQNQDVIIKLPLKWLALESINDGVFSEKSDVWSFGVTCWEIFNGGKTPYPGISPVDLPHQLETGFRMDKPLNAACSDDVYSLMVDCWVVKPELRPPFAELVSRLSSQLIILSDYMDFSPTQAEANWM